MLKPRSSVAIEGARCALEPLYGPPEPPRFASYDDVCAPFTAARALHNLLSIGLERHLDSMNVISQCKHRLNLGNAYFTQAQLEREAKRLERETRQAAIYEWCERAFWGLPRREYDVNDHRLLFLLDELQSEDDRYWGLTLEDLLSELIEVLCP